MLEPVRIRGVRRCSVLLALLLASCVQTTSQPPAPPSAPESQAASNAPGASTAAAGAAAGSPAGAAASTAAGAAALQASASGTAAGAAPIPASGVPGSSADPAVASPAPPPAHPGKAVYDRACSACHDRPQDAPANQPQDAAANQPQGASADQPNLTRAPSLTALKAMRYGQLHYALTDGKMAAQGAMLSSVDRASVIDFLAGRAVADDEWIDKMMCAPNRRLISLRMPATVATFGFDKRNTRNLTSEQAGFTRDEVKNLELAWALAVPRATTVRAQPAVVGSTLFIPLAESPTMVALDVSREQPCLKWVYRTDLPLRTGVGYGSLPGGRKVLVFADVAAQVHMVDAATGEFMWRTRVGMWGLSNTTGTPVIHGARVYVPLSASEINVGANEDHECCKTHGAVIALQSLNGRKVWVTHMMEDAKPVRDRGDGKMIWGPSGAPIWNSPSIDEKRGVLYVGTGEATSEPAEKTTDAIVAIDLKDGRIRWSFQATDNDIFLTGCLFRPDGLNCPKESRMLDVDFGASTILATGPDGKDILLAGQKSGTLWALDPDARGKLLWRRDFGTGSPLGGIHWGIAFDGERVFAPIHFFPGRDGKDPNQVPGIHGVKVDTGEVLWSYESKPDCSGDRPSRVTGCDRAIGFSGAPTVIDGAVFQGSVDGYLRAFDAQTGEVLFEYDTARSYETVNGVPGKGGSIDNASIVATNGYLFVNSGYALIGGQTPGNVILAFRPRR